MELGRIACLKIGLGEQSHERLIGAKHGLQSGRTKGVAEQATGYVVLSTVPSPTYEK